MPRSKRPATYSLGPKAQTPPTSPGAWNNIANAHIMLSQVDEAEASYEKATRCDQSAGRGPPRLGDSSGQPRPNPSPDWPLLESTRMSKRVLQVWTRAYGPDSERLTIPLINLAEDSRSLEKWEDSIAYDARAVEIYERALGQDHVTVATPLYGIGMSHYWMGEFEKARGYFERVLAIREGAWGKEDARLGYALQDRAMPDRAAAGARSGSAAREAGSAAGRRRLRQRQPGYRSLHLHHGRAPDEARALRGGDPLPASHH